MGKIINFSVSKCELCSSSFQMYLNAFNFSLCVGLNNNLTHSSASVCVDVHVGMHSVLYMHDASRVNGWEKNRVTVSSGRSVFESSDAHHFTFPAHPHVATWKHFSRNSASSDDVFWFCFRNAFWWWDCGKVGNETRSSTGHLGSVVLSHNDDVFYSIMNSSNCTLSTKADFHFLHICS